MSERHYFFRHASAQGHEPACSRHLTTGRCGRPAADPVHLARTAIRPAFGQSVYLDEQPDGSTNLRLSVGRQFVTVGLRPFELLALGEACLRRAQGLR